MAIESATYVSQLNATLPTALDVKSEGDDQIRLVKAVLLARFPNVSGAVTATHTTLNTIATKASKTGENYSGTHDFTAATVTFGSVSIPAPTTSLQPATKGYVDSFAFNQARPASSEATKGKSIVNDGSTVAWGNPTLTATSLYFSGI